MGNSHYCPPTIASEAVRRVAQGLSRYCTDEEHCEELHVVARTRQQHPECGQCLSALSSCQESTSSGAIAALGVAIPAMGKSVP